jgi:hypothetical protein
MIGIITGNAPTSPGYSLGLSNNSSYKIVLAKQTPVTGLDEDDSGVLRASTASYTETGDDVSEWFHLRLDVLVNPHSEVVINCYRNSGDVDTPVWAAIPGMDSYIDDSLGAITGTVPYTGSFYFFFGHYANNGLGKVSLFDHITVARQTYP